LVYIGLFFLKNAIYGEKKNERQRLSVAAFESEHEQSGVINIAVNAGFVLEG